MKLIDIARVVRSKNAGPLTLTIDLMFDDPADYELALASPSLACEEIAACYGVPVDSVAIVPYKAALAIKVVLPRNLVAGSPGDRDVYGAQQHALLLDLEL